MTFFKHKSTRKHLASTRLSIEALDPRLVLTVPGVQTTTPELDDNPVLEAGVKKIKVQFTESMLDGANTAHYQLRGAGGDGALDTADDDLIAFTQSQYKGRTASLWFDVLPPNDYRFTVFDTIMDDDGFFLDGDGNSQEGGAYQREFSIVPAEAKRIHLGTFPSEIVAGESNSLDVMVTDRYGNIQPNYTGTVTFQSEHSTADLPADYTFTPADQGERTFDVTLNTPDSRTWVRVLDVDQGFKRTATGIEVIEDSSPPPTPLEVSQLVVSGYPGTTVAGVSNNFVVSAVDINGDVVTDFTGTVSFSISDSQADVPANFTYTTSDAGDRAFSATFKTAGTHTLTATLVGDSSVTGSQSGINTVAADASKIALGSFPAQVTVGQSNPLVVTMLDDYNNVATDYTGTVHFESDDSAASLPADYTFSTSDNGSRQFNVTLNTPDSGAFLRVSDVAEGFSQSITGIVVNGEPSEFGSLSVTAYPSVTEAGVSQNFVVAALDSNGDLFTDFTGTVTFSGTDPLAALPSDYVFTTGDGGDRTFSATFKTAGTHTLTATMVSDSNVTGSQTGIQTQATDLDDFELFGYPEVVVAGQEHPFTVVAVDRYGNQVTDYTGTVFFESSSVNAVLPDDYTFTTADGGTKEFTARLLDSGQNRSITVRDQSDPTIMGRQSNIVVQVGSVRYSSTSNIIYLEDGITATLSDINFLLPNAPLTLVDESEGIWKLDANIRVVDGSTLHLHGSSIGGDVNELRLKSDNDGSGHVEIRADYGNIEIKSTFITSWDDDVNGPDMNYSNGRAYVRARSKLADDGVTPLESRMDVIDSEVGYLGFAGGEAYGLSWKVNGDPGPNFELYDQVEVYGDIIDSHIHHNYFGMYSFGAYGMIIRGNEVSHNVLYGLDPHDDSDFLIIEDNYSHHNGTHGIIISKRCDNVIFRNNVSNNNGGNGIMLHRESNDALVENNTTVGNGDSGIAIFASNNIVIRNNISQDNKHGIRFSVGSADNLIEDNDFSFNSERGINFFQGSDTPTPGDDGRPKRNTFRNNTINENGANPIRVRDGDENVFENNEILDNGRIDIVFEYAVDNVFVGNIVDGDARLKLRGTESIFTTLFVGDQPGLDTSVDSYSQIIYIGSGSSSAFASGKAADDVGPTKAGSVVLDDQPLRATAPVAAPLVENSGSQSPVTSQALDNIFNQLEKYAGDEKELQSPELLQTQLDLSATDFAFSLGGEKSQI